MRATAFFSRVEMDAVVSRAVLDLADDVRGPIGDGRSYGVVPM